MKETVKNLNIKGLYVISMKLNSYRWCKLMSEKHNEPIRNYTSHPINKITDFIKLFEENLKHLDWNVEEFTEEHGNAISKMEKKININELGVFFCITSITT